MCMPGCQREVTRAKPIVCAFCGATDDVVVRNEYVGGIGSIPIPQCENRIRCWALWDMQRGLSQYCGGK